MVKNWEVKLIKHNSRTKIRSVSVKHYICTVVSLIFRCRNSYIIFDSDGSFAAKNIILATVLRKVYIQGNESEYY